MRRAAVGIAVLAAAVYTALPLRSSPNPVDGGLLFGYLQLLADGGRPFHDFLDVYGLAHWPLMSWAYQLSGQRVLGVRVLLWLLKLGTLFAAHALLGRLADRRAAWLGTLCLTILFGLPWNYLQTPYAFVPVQLLTIGVVWLLVRGRGTAELLAAGALTALALCMKLNAGAFLLAGGLIAVVYFRGSGADADQRARQPRMPWLWRCVRVGGLLALLVCLGLFMRRHFDAFYFAYLGLPLVLCAAWALDTPDTLGMRARLRDAALYGCASVGGAWSYVTLAIGPASVGRYVEEVGAILVRLDYHSPPPPLGQPGTYVGFNEWLWPELPWLVTALTAALLVQARRTGRRVDPRLGTLFAVHACQLCVIYARSDETHLLQALPLTLVTLFAVLHALASRAAAARGARWQAFAYVLALGWTSSLASWPGLSRLLGPGDWHGERLSGLWYMDGRFDTFLRNPGALDLRSWDATNDEAARYIASVSTHRTRTLMLDPTELLIHASGTRPAGGRYHYLFYLVQAGFFTRTDFDAVAPPTLLPELLRDPPEVIVTTFVPGVMEAAFPELPALIAERYRLGRKVRHLNVWLRRD